mgnify:CR=1 FL=1|jgi:hypothetical protein
MNDHCEGKTSYGSYRKAKQDMRLIRAQSKKSEVPVRTYKCGKCGNWHLTSSRDSFKESAERKMSKKHLY